jgi:hypothetical protein
MAEQWRPVVGYEGLYEVSDLGRIRSVDRVDSSGKRRQSRLIKPTRSKDEYRKVCLSRGSKVQQISLHRLVALHFIPNPCDLPEVDHINCDRTDNRVENLQWASRSDNRRFSWARGSRVVDMTHMAKMQEARWITRQHCQQVMG